MRRIVLAVLLVAAACSREPDPPLEAPETGWVEVAPRQRIFYDIQGQGDTLIFIHGGYLDRRMWREQVEEFRDSYTIVRYDLRGFGRSDLPRRAYRPAQDLLALYDALQLGRATLIGHSMGGWAAIAFTLAHPERVNALVLAASPAPGLPLPEEETDPLLEVFATRERAGPDSALVQWLHHPVLASLRNRSELANQVEFLARENERFLTLRFWPFQPEDPPPAARLGEIAVPTLVIWGDRDSEMVRQNSVATAARIPNARAVTLRGAGHLLNLERPSDFNRALRALLELDDE
jgi:pimeloyl-ACP methyl ester carboxylesterase